MNLSADQLAAISHRGSHLQIIACAGSGKTEVMARRVAALVEEGAAPASIVAFTFTERAAASLKLRIHKRVADSMGAAYLDRLGPMFTGTIHSYCLRMLQENVPHYRNHDVLDENRLAGLLSREFKRLELNRLGNKHWNEIFEFLRNAQVVENELIPVKHIASTDFGFCYQKFTDILKRYHFLSFGQLITTAIDALRDAAIFKRVHDPLRHLLVDEYQDINPAQEELIDLLAGPPVHLCVVGDDDQSIYQWRGSDVNNILTFTKRYKPAKNLPLSLNRRSRPKIIHHANQFVESIAPRMEKKMQPHRPAGATEVHCWAGDTDQDEANTVADTIERLVKLGYRYRDIAVLLRSVRTSAEPLIDTLRDRDIPFRCAGRTGLFRQPEASVLGKTYAWLVNNDWKNERFATPEHISLDRLVAEYRTAFCLDAVTAAELKAYLADWKKYVSDNTSQVNLVRDYYRLLRLLSVQELDLENPQDSARGQLDHYDKSKHHQVGEELFNLFEDIGQFVNQVC